MIPYRWLLAAASGECRLQGRMAQVSQSIPLRDEDRVLRPFRGAASRDPLDADPEPSLSQPERKPRIRVSGPHAEDSVFSKRSVDGTEAGGLVEALVSSQGERLRTVIDVKNDRVERSRAIGDQAGDVTFEEPHPRILER